MTIYSWNMLYRNAELERAFEFLAHANFDVFCLQEVPEVFLERLTALPYSLAYRVDQEKLTREGGVPMYNVILSRHPITGQKEILFADYWDELPLRTRVFTFLMRPWHFARVRNRGGLYADISILGRTVRVFDLHLSLAYPAQRLKELEQALTEWDATLPTIVCGDFNILEAPHIVILNWLLGGRIRDVLFYSRERAHSESIFAKHLFVNPLRGSVTHNLSRSQLDHILVSDSFSIQKAEVLSDSLGSDHHPICVIVS